MSKNTKEEEENKEQKDGNSNKLQYSKKIGNYILFDQIGMGTFSKVTKAIHVLTEQTVAVKILEKAKIQDEVDIERIIREIEILKNISHPNIAQMYETYSTIHNFYLMMEYVEGGDLFDYICNNNYLKEHKACMFFRQLIGVIEYLTEMGITHRDIKPENILIDETFKNIKVIDFGLSNYCMGNELLKSSCGSPCYASPEMLSGDPYRGITTDLWSSGIVLYSMLVGSLPFDDQELHALYDQIKVGKFYLPSTLSLEAIDLLKRILQVNPSKRITLEEIKKHPWFNLETNPLYKGINIGIEDFPYDSTVIDYVLKNYFSDDEEITKNAFISMIKTHACNQYTATYYLAKKYVLHLKDEYEEQKETSSSTKNVRLIAVNSNDYLILQKQEKNKKQLDNKRDNSLKQANTKGQNNSISSNKNDKKHLNCFTVDDFDGIITNKKKKIKNHENIQTETFNDSRLNEVNIKNKNNKNYNKKIYDFLKNNFINKERKVVITNNIVKKNINNNIINNIVTQDIDKEKDGFISSRNNNNFIKENLTNLTGESNNLVDLKILNNQDKGIKRISKSPDTSNNGNYYINTNNTITKENKDSQQQERSDELSKDKNSNHNQDSNSKTKTKVLNIKKGNNSKSEENNKNYNKIKVSPNVNNKQETLAEYLTNKEREQQISKSQNKQIENKENKKDSKCKNNLNNNSGCHKKKGKNLVTNFGFPLNPYIITSINNKEGINITKNNNNNKHQRNLSSNIKYQINNYNTEISSFNPNNLLQNKFIKNNNNADKRKKLILLNNQKDTSGFDFLLKFTQNKSKNKNVKTNYFLNNLSLNSPCQTEGNNLMRTCHMNKTYFKNNLSIVLKNCLANNNNGINKNFMYNNSKAETDRGRNKNSIDSKIFQ